MNNTVRTIGAVLSSILVFSCASAEKPKQEAKAPLFSCYRHIVNNSSCPWTFRIEPHHGQHGNVYFGNVDTTACTQKNGPCTVPAGTTLDLQYTYTDGAADGQMDIKDQNGTENAWIYGNSVINQCVSFNHKGNTGSVALNDPSGGDMNAWACTW